VKPFRLLFSYAYYGRHDLDEIIARDLVVKPDLFADSGGFTAHSLGQDITVDQYADWLHRWEDRFDVYANLDAIGSDEESARETLANQAEMEAHGLAPAPVFHGGEPWRFLEAYCERYDYVCLGGMVAHGMPAAMRWCAQAFQIGQKHGTRFHGFGQTNLRIIKTFPWYSIDSSSWGAGHRYGIVHLWDDRRGRWEKFKLGSTADATRLRRLAREHGADPAVLARPGCGIMRDDFTVEDVRDERAMVSAANMIAWRRLEDWLGRWHAESVKVYLAGKFTPTQLGGNIWPRVYLAEGTWSNFTPAINGAAAYEGGDR